MALHFALFVFSYRTIYSTLHAIRSTLNAIH